MKDDNNPAVTADHDANNLDPDLKTNNNSNLTSSSSPFPASTLDKGVVRKKPRLPAQFRQNIRGFSSLTEQQRHQQQDWNNTRRSVSAGAVLCSKSQGLFQRPPVDLHALTNHPVDMFDQLPMATRSFRLFGTNRFVAIPSTSQSPQFVQQQQQSRNSDLPSFMDPRFNCRPIHSTRSPHLFPQPVFSSPSSTFFNNRSSDLDDSTTWLGAPLQEMPMGIQATMHGFMSLKLHSDVRVDITVDQSVRIISNSKGIIVTLNSTGTAAAMIHPSGRIYQYGSRVEVATTDPRGNSKLAKMWHKGVSFTSEHSALVYLVDAAGTRTTTDCFSDTYGDISMPVFLQNSMHGPGFIPECIRQIHRTEYWVSRDGIENWSVNGLRISQAVDGLVRVARGPGKYVLRVSPQNQTASLSTPYVHATASVGNGRDCHVFVKRGERRMHYDGNTFIVRNGTHAAGFDEKSQLKVY